MQKPSKQRNNRTSAPETLEPLDCRILEALQRDPRLRATDLGRLVGLSAPAVTERMRRLEESGVVTYRAVVDPRALGYVLNAIVRVSPQSRKLHMIPNIARDVPEVTECYRSRVRTAISCASIFGRSMISNGLWISSRRTDARRRRSCTHRR